MAGSKATIRVGIGGWTYEPWRGLFYPADLPHSRELEFASRKLTAIEVNGTYYSTQKPATFARWRDETPDGFVFSLKANRFATMRRVLADAGESIERFVGSGIAELGDKLGPLVWQLAPTKRFEPDDLEAFMKLLPASVGGIALRHVLDVRHESFMVPEYLALARRYKVATVFCDSDEYPSFCDITGDFVYARLMRTESRQRTGYPPTAIRDWAERARLWAAGHEPPGLPCIEEKIAPVRPRDVFLFFISGAKERAPAAAMALIDGL
ncbi:DUF72 domain-containing protein [Piscinibacter sakaiensis]|uniref:DUF72 domain-containing protein n=1 Tax=Piscinibacter sakaiensis TaxID=1547922 RepID=UPI003AB0A430